MVVAGRTACTAAGITKGLFSVIRGRDIANHTFYLLHTTQSAVLHEAEDRCHRTDWAALFLSMYTHLLTHPHRLLSPRKRLQSSSRSIYFSTVCSQSM